MLSVDRVLSVVVAVEASATARVSRLQASLQRCLPNWQVRVEVLVFCAFGRASWAPLNGFNACVFHREPGPLPIIQARNICQRHLYYLMQECDGLGLILDDDLVWTLTESHFESLNKVLRNESCDMALLGVSGDPAVPREYVRAAPLLDYLIHVSASGDAVHGSAVQSYLSGFEPGTDLPNEAHHDYYAFTRCGFLPFVFEHAPRSFFQRLSSGKTTTRTTRISPSVRSLSTGQRGGATLIADADLLLIPNESVTLGNWVSRRSDMVMAERALRQGYRLCSTPVVLAHERQDSFDSDSADKLVSDVLGAAYVESVRGGGNVVELAMARSAKTRMIIEETTRMLALCRSLPVVSVDDVALIEGMMESNERALSALLVFEKKLPVHSLTLCPCFPVGYIDSCVLELRYNQSGKIG